MKALYQNRGKADGNISTAREVYELSVYNLYDDLEKMIGNEELDVIDICVPTYLHAEMTCSLLERDFGFYMGYRVKFEQGKLVFDSSLLKVNLNDGPGFIAELSPDVGYYRELVYFLDAIIHGKPILICTADSAVESLEIVEVEVRSADAEGEWVVLD